MNKIVLFILLIISSCCTSMEKKNVAVEIKKVVIPVNGKAEYHLHPCPVVGHIVSGTLLFQIEGEKPQLIKAGEAFYEPKNKPILHFDNALDSEPLVFMAYYLVEENEDLLMLLPE